MFYLSALNNLFERHVFNYSLKLIYITSLKEDNFDNVLWLLQQRQIYATTNTYFTTSFTNKFS